MQMKKADFSTIKSYALNPSLFQIHKEAGSVSDFGLDNTPELLAGGFGLYSAANVRSSFGPLKLQFYRVALVRAGTARFNIGIEPFDLERDFILFGFPGQVFTLCNRSDDFQVYYMLFNEAFIPENLLMKSGREPYPFLSFHGTPCFKISADAGYEIEDLIMKINLEVKRRPADVQRMIQLNLQVILMHAYREYERLGLHEMDLSNQGNGLFTRFLKLVNRHFMELRKVSDYARLLNVSPDHLQRTIRQCSEKTASELIDAMILTEAKAYLLQTELSNAEIAYKLEFSDPSHFNKFFKKLTSTTPLQFRDMSLGHHTKSF